MVTDELVRRDVSIAVELALARGLHNKAQEWVRDPTRACRASRNRLRLYRELCS